MELPLSLTAFKAQLQRAVEERGLRVHIRDNSFSVRFPHKFPIRRYSSARLSGRFAASQDGIRVTLTTTPDPVLVVSITLWWGFMVFFGLPLIGWTLFQDGFTFACASRFAMAVVGCVLVPPAIGAAFYFIEGTILTERLDEFMMGVQTTANQTVHLL